MKFKHIFLFLVTSNFAFAQVDSDLRFRYWKLRQKLLDNFIVIGDCHGCSLPATSIDFSSSDHEILNFEDETPRELNVFLE
jgi:hypothetical protein